MPASTTPPRPRLVRSDEPPSDAGAPRTSRWRPWLLPLLLLALAVVAAVGWGSESRRSAELEAQVAELGGALEAARGEIAARQRHLEALRGAAADVEARVVELRALAEQAPTAATPARAPEAPAGTP
jgi:Tfp pilus assembly protein FimV